MTNDRYRDTLELDFADMDIKSRNQLAYLMRKEGYRTKMYSLTRKEAFTSKSHGHKIVRRKDGFYVYVNKYPSQYQLDVAWNWLKEKEIYQPKRRSYRRKREGYSRQKKFEV